MQPDEKTTTTSAADPGSRAAHMVSDVLAGLNHEIRTSMNGIVGMLDMLLDSGLPSSHRDLASTAQRSAENLIGFIEAAVDLAAMNNGGLHLESRPFELSAMLEEAVGNAGTSVQRPSRPFPAALLQGDRHRMLQVLAGLIRAAKDVGGTVKVSAHAERHGTQCAVAIEVTASRCCDSAVHLTELIDAPPSGVEIVRTHGRLGLDIQASRRLAQLMGGSISIRPLPEASHTLRFELALPLAAASLQGGHLLIIEKQDEDRKSLEALFARHGMEVDAFASAAAAVDALRRPSGKGYRAAIIGQDEQGLDAAFLAAAIRADAQYGALPMVALADTSPDGLSAELAQAGFDAVIARPVNEAVALQAIAALCGEPEMQDIADSRVTGAEHAPRHDFHGRRILVADDNSVNLQVARRMLEKLGCRVDVAMDGGEAVMKHSAEPYELILMDCQMPGVDGCEAATRIRALVGDASRVPVVAVTACTTQSERECCLSAGMDDFIAKPLRPQALDAALSKWLQKQLPASPAPESPCKDDLDAIKEMFGDDFTELAKLYEADSPPRITMLHSANAAGDAKTVARIAHAFAGSSASIGASGLSVLCKELELHAKTGALDEFGQRMAAIEVEYKRICGRLHSLVNQS